jgi:pyrroline-5-carboxylate reductase
MATALLAGIVHAKFCTSQQVSVSDPAAASLTSMSKLLPGCFTSTDNVAVAARSDVLIIAVKPQIVPIVLEQIKHVLTDKHLLISVAAGVTIASMQAIVPGARLIRVMPNTPALCGAGAAGFALGSHATVADEKTAQTILGSVGRAWRVDEKLLDAVCGLSGSGPAYIFMMIEALADGGVLAGLPRDIALQLAAQTTFGASKLLLESAGKHPAALRDSVTSPGGTTAAGLLQLENAAVRAAFTKAVQAAANRSTELGQASAKAKL